jgi:rubrerythrin
MHNRLISTATVFSMTVTSTLLLNETPFTLPRKLLFTQCELFETDPSLLSTPYRVKSSSSLEAFQQFLDFIQGKDVEVTQATCDALSSLSHEFGSVALSTKVAEFRASLAFSQDDSRISFLEEQVASSERRILTLEAQIASYEQRLKCLETNHASQNEQLQSSLGRVNSVEAAVSDLRTAVAGGDSRQVNELNREVKLLKQKVGEIDSIRNSLGVAESGISMVAAVLSRDIPQFLSRLGKAKCSYCSTGLKFTMQPIWCCRTCGLVQPRGCCPACAFICHEGHNIYFFGCSSGGFFCDCGSGDGPHPCQCLK